MAEKLAIVEKFLSCHVCSETFRDPVSLSCNHSFCSSCLQKFWEQTKNKNCPICKRKSSKDYPSVNFALKELADSFTEGNKSGSSETEKAEKKLTVVCSKHETKSKLFCVDEQRAVCPGCEFSLHQSHKVVPVEEAVSDLKKQLKSDLKSLKDKRNKYKQVEETYNEMIQHSKKQLLSTERQIRAEFNKLQQFLKEEEESRLAALKEEEEQKGRTISREMKMIEEQISSLSDSICAVEEELQKHSVPFLSSYKDTQSRARAQSSVSDPQLVSGALIDVAKHLGNLSFRVWEKMKEKKWKTISREMKMIEEQISSLSDSICAVEEELQKHSVPFLSSYKDTQSRARAQSSLSDPQLVSGALIDVAKHLGNLSFRVWEKMKEKVHFSPVILDPNTASGWLYLSDDLTSVRCGDTKQQLPDNPERNTNHPTVFGSEGFSSGKHSWEVEVGDHPDWNVGLVKESVDRKGKLFASPKYGIWCLWHKNGKYTNGDGRTLTVKKSLQRISVQLDYDRGEVSFYDPEDMTHIYTHRDTFTEKLFPYFEVVDTGDAEITDIKIYQTEI
uniref:Nuclear factor 7, brain-like n=1 Tax=Oreochromis aureus TaxID=47969 RepID=A0AAZ1X7I4_OREAU